MKHQLFSNSLRRSIGLGKIKSRFLVSLAVFLLIQSWQSLPLTADTPRTGAVQEIIGGSNKPAGTPSWMVALVSKPTSADIPVKRLQFCGGVLVSAEWVLTAAHCVLRSSTANTAVIIGQNDIDAAVVEQRELSQIVIHPNYNSRTFENDVAMLKLEVATKLQPISFLDESMSSNLVGENATAFGWGQTYVSPQRCEPVFADGQQNTDDFTCRIHDFDRASREFQGRLLQANITILSEADCNARIHVLLQSLDIEGDGIDDDTDFTPPNQLCAYDPIEQKGVCFGDSGGPLTIEQNGKQFLVGTASLIYGSGGCAREFATDVFTLTAPFSSFMDDVMHRDYALSFESFCPRMINPAVEYEKAEDASTLTRILWSSAEGVESYIVRYSNTSTAQDEISTLVLDGTLSEISAQLQPGTSFYFSIQARNASCTGPVSVVQTVQVPVL